LGYSKRKTAGFGPKTNQALVFALVLPFVVILGLEKLLDSQVIAALLGGALGFGVSKRFKDE
jgi:hypothetical protein